MNMNTSSTPSMSGKQQDDIENKSLVDEDLINVEGTKLVISKQLVKRCVIDFRKSFQLLIS